MTPAGHHSLHRGSTPRRSVRASSMRRISADATRVEPEAGNNASMNTAPQ
jgi:hypothetical protein